MTPTPNGGAARRLRDCLYLFPQLFGAPGGIQAVNHDTLRAVIGACPAARHRVLLYHDREVPSGSARVDRRVHFVPCGTVGGASRGRFVRAFAGALIEERPDLIVVGHAGLAPLAWSAKRLFGIPYVGWIYGVELQRLRGPVQRAAIRGADRLVAISRHTRRELAAVDAEAAGRAVVLPCTVRAQFRPGSGAAVRRQLGLDREPVLLTVARYDPGQRHKGYDLVVRALPSVLARCPDARYVLVGEGDDLPRVRELARGLGVGHALVCAGRVPDEALPAWYNACDLFVMPSRGEGFGIVFLEALACGRPVIAGDRDGARDAVLDGRLGRMVDPDDPAALADAIVDFLTGRAPSELTDPARLRRACLEHFGRAAFEERIRKLLGILPVRCA